MRQTSWRLKAAVATVMVLTGIEAHARQNPSPAEDSPARIPTRRIVVSLAERKLAFLENGVVAKIYDVAVGAPVSPSPVGTYRVTNRVERPAYYTPGKIIPPGSGNPVGTRWIGLSIKGFGIHGTNLPDSIGKAASHGCIRLRNKDVEELFEMVQEGDLVELHSESNEELQNLFGSSLPATPGQASQSAAVFTPANR